MTPEQIEQYRQRWAAISGGKWFVQATPGAPGYDVVLNGGYTLVAAMDERHGDILLDALTTANQQRDEAWARAEAVREQFRMSGGITEYRGASYD